MFAATFMTLGSSGICHEHALLGCLEFQGLEGAEIGNHISEFLSDELSPA